MKIHNFSWQKICTINHQGILISFDKAQIDHRARSIQLFRNDKFAGLVLPQQFDNFLHAAEALLNEKITEVAA